MAVGNLFSVLQCNTSWMKHAAPRFHTLILPAWIEILEWSHNSFSTRLWDGSDPLQSAHKIQIVELGEGAFPTSKWVDTAERAGCWPQAEKQGHQRVPLLAFALWDGVDFTSVVFPHK